MTEPADHSEKVLAEALRAMAGENPRGPASAADTPPARVPLNRVQVLLAAILIGLIVGVVSGLLLA